MFGKGVRYFWEDCQRDRPEGFDSLGWFILCAGLIAIIFRRNPFEEIFNVR